MFFTAGRSVASHLMSPDDENKTKKKRRDKNVITIRIQSDGLKKPLDVDIDKTKKFSILLWKFADTLKCDGEKLKLKFDGEWIEPNETPMDLDMEGGEMIDCVLVK